ncbi:UNVERIFIED_CONTAM: hypothetical protein HDU68_011744 [Siphonaria sp. JEL0065]|nr:hypothetical protein HDU68_011744 [Siphonaria sp. JEL0065]
MLCVHVSFVVSLIVFLVFFILVDLPYIKYYNPVQGQITNSWLSDRYCCTHYCDTTSCSKAPDGAQSCDNLQTTLEAITTTNATCSTNPLISLVAAAACAPTDLVSLACQSRESNSCRESDGDGGTTNSWIRCAMNCKPCITVNLNVTAQVSGSSKSGVFTTVVPDTAAGNDMLASYKNASNVTGYYERSNSNALVAEIPLTTTPEGYWLFFICLVLLMTSMVETYFLASFFRQSDRSMEITFCLWIGIIVPFAICLPVALLAHIPDSWKHSTVVTAIVLASFGNAPLFTWLLSRVIPDGEPLWVYIWIVAIPLSVYLPIILYAPISHTAVIIVGAVWVVHVVGSGAFVVIWKKDDLKALFVMKPKPETTVELGTSNSWTRSSI